MKKALQLIGIQKDTLHAGSVDALGFIAANKIHTLISYRQVVFWVGNCSSPELTTVSGNATIDQKGQYANWIRRTIKKYTANNAVNLHALNFENIDERDKADWQQFGLSNVTIIIFKTDTEGSLGGVWIEHDKPYTDAEITIWHELQGTFSAALALQNLRTSRSLFFRISNVLNIRTGKYKYYILAVCLALMFFPVRLSITAPAEIISSDPGIVAPVYDGVVKDILVEPGDEVKKYDPLVIMDDQSLMAEKRATEEDLRVARAKLSRLKREALLEPEKKIELQRIQSEISLKQIEYDYATQKLQRSVLRSPKNGVAVFSDAQSIIGKPIPTGQSIMQVASLADAELFIRIPVQSMLRIDDDVPVEFYMNVAPLETLEGRILSMGYQASADADGLLTYKVRASLPEGYSPRIGWKGTAKVYGEWSVLIYAVLRRPLISLRDITGL